MTLSHPRRWLAAAALLATPIAFAQGGAPSGLQREAREAPQVCACLVSPSEADADTAPGPYARYLMLNGMSKERAMEAARTVDSSTRRTARAMSNEDAQRVR